MKKICLPIVTAAAIVLLCACSVFADGPIFTFKIPTIPFTPVMSDITNSKPVIGAKTITVYASIKGELQQKACCGTNCDRTDCDKNEWYMKTDDSISPNPPCIPNENGDPSNPGNTACVRDSGKNPLLYYYKESEGSSTAQSVSMAYDSVTKKFKGTIPIEGNMTGESIMYYIVASDSRGNVISMVPDKDKAPCSSPTSWNSSYETPAIDNCAISSGYEECSKNKDGTPACASSDYSINDRKGDTCGPPDATGNQTIVSSEGQGSPAENVDILGFSAGAGKGYSALPNDDVICTKVGLKGQPTSGGGPIEAYLMIFFNPDINDSNPADIYFPNVFAISYAPEAGGMDPNLVSVLWDGECVSNPNTADILTCKIVVGKTGETGLNVGFDEVKRNLTFIAKNSLKNGKTIMGTKSSMLRMVLLTGEIDIRAASPFWLVDLTSGLMMVKDTRRVPISDEIPPPPAPIITDTTCLKNESGGSNICGQGSPSCAPNECKIDFVPPPGVELIGKYKLYHSMTNNPDNAEYMASMDVAENGSASYQSTYTVPGDKLDGSTHYFFITSVNNIGTPPLETGKHDASVTSFTVDDCDPPSSGPRGFSCSTPDGNDRKCNCSWLKSLDDPSIYGYEIKRNGVQLNTRTIRDEFYTDSDSSLADGNSYAYSVRAIDVGGNCSPWTDTSCIPEDKKAPAKVEAPGIVVKCPGGVVEVAANWQPGGDADIAGYNLYACKRVNEGVDCETKDGSNGGAGYMKLNTAIIPQPNPSAPVSFTARPGDEGWWAFYVEACDNCKTAGTCPSKIGTESNCSGFDTMTMYRRSMSVTCTIDTYGPLWPQPQTDGKEVKMVSDSDGTTCRLEWNKICADEEKPFANCDYPEAGELMGYYIVRREQTGGSCASTQMGDPAPDNIVGTTGAYGDPAFTNSGLPSNKKYCYRVHGYDVSGRYSRQDPKPEPVECDTLDKNAPDKPAMKAMEFDNISCTPNWTAVKDKDAGVNYKVYRCTGDSASCDNESKFTGDLTPDGITALQYTDDTVTEEHPYIYCVTATDASGNQSMIYDPADRKNCGYCLPSNRCKPPKNVTAYEFNSQHGAKVLFENSDGDNGAPYVTGEGYNVFLCTGADSASCGTKSLNVDMLQQIFATEPYALPVVNVPVEGDYRMGVSFTGDPSAVPQCVESLKTVSNNAIHIIPDDICDSANPPAADCSVTIDFGTSTFQKYKLVACKIATEPACAANPNSDACPCRNDSYKKVMEPIDGVTVEVVDAADTAGILKKKSSDMNGNVKKFKVKKGETGKSYKVRAKIPLAKVDPVFSFALCTEKTTADCIVDLKKNVPLTADSTVNVTPIEIPDSTTGAYGGDIGNTNCDGVVDLKDLMAIRKSFRSRRGDACYKAWADFNMDGVVDIKEIPTLRKYFRKQIYSGKITDGVLCADKDPVAACCPKCE